MAGNNNTTQEIKEAVLNEIEAIGLASIILAFASSLSKDMRVHNTPLMIIITALVLVANIVVQFKTAENENVQYTVVGQLARLAVNVFMLVVGGIVYIAFMIANGLKADVSDLVPYERSIFQLTATELSTFTIYTLIRTVLNILLLGGALFADFLRR